MMAAAGHFLRKPLPTPATAKGYGVPRSFYAQPPIVPGGTHAPFRCLW